MDNYVDINARTIDSWIENGWEWGVPISHEEYAAVKSGKWKVLLTPIRPVPEEWFEPFLRNGRLDGVKLLGLASGGGQQMPVFASLGADCAVMDYSDKQLESERFVAEREGYAIEIVKGDMTKGFPFNDNSFDIIFHPVSNCYVEDVLHVWKECFRVLKRGGLLLAGMDNGINFLFEDNEELPLIAANKLPFNPLKDPDLFERSIKNNDGIQFSHTMEDQIGGQLKAGFILRNLYEDRDTAGVIKEYFPQYMATRSIKEFIL